MTEVVINVFLDAFDRVNEVPASMGPLDASVCDTGVELVAIDIDMARDLVEYSRQTQMTASDIRGSATQYESPRTAALYERVWMNVRISSEGLRCERRRLSIGRWLIW